MIRNFWVLGLLAGLFCCSGPQPRQQEQFQTWLQELESDESATRSQAEESLVSAGYPVIPLLREALLSDRPPQWLPVSRVLLKVGAPSVPVLIEGLQSPPAARKTAAAEALGLMGPPAKNSVPFLIRALVDPDPALRETSARALGKLGGVASLAIPELRKLSQDPQAAVRAAARQAVETLETGE